MASQWAKDLPVVTVHRGEAPKRVTLVVPYYENPEFFENQIYGWASYSEALRKQLSLIVVDDGSQASPAAGVVAEHREMEPALYGKVNHVLATKGMLRLFRIGIDVPWNWIAARNIGAHHAEDGWLLLTDMDHVVPAETIESLVYGQHDPSIVYVFSRAEHTGEVVTPHSASFFMTREMFWKIGGYDEELSGRYGTDGEFRKRIAAVAPIHVLADKLIRHEYVGDSSTTRYARKRPEDALAVKRIVSSRLPGWRPRTLSFPYQEVTC